MGSAFFETCPATTGEPVGSARCTRFADGPHRCKKNPADHSLHECSCGYKWQCWTYVGEVIKSSLTTFVYPDGGHSVVEMGGGGQLYFPEGVDRADS